MRTTLALVLLAAVSCAEPTGYRARFYPTAGEIPAADKDADFLKVHTKDGRVFVLAQWSVDGSAARGIGRVYDADRKLLNEGPQTVPTSDVAIFETARPEAIPRSAGGYIVLGLLTAGSIALSAYCLSNPKACFGSCPTFYVHDGTAWKLQAEGFSASIARTLEATDVDAMWTAHATGTLDVQMANEALETHLVDHVRVLAAPRAANMRVYQSGGTYWSAPSPTPPTACTAASGDCLSDVRAIDESAYLSKADSVDLTTKETVELTFDRPAGKRLGLVFAARNSLLNTFVFYQGLSYAGKNASDWYALLETGKPENTAAPTQQLRNLVNVFGGIELAVQTKGEWRSAGTYFEVGPIAREVEMLPLPEELGPEPLRVRLTMSKGSWKLDHVGLVAIGARVEPTALEPKLVTRNGAPDAEARRRLLPGGDRLMTYPGDLYTMRFDLPPGDSELFLESRGYYYEWMREHWLAEESPIDVGRMMLDPARAMRDLAPRYKRIEDQMEQVFWNSRVGVHQ